MKKIIFIIMASVITSAMGSSVPLFSGDVTGFELIDLDNGKIKESKNSDKFMIPASTTKLLTAGYLLETLGSDFRFKTEILIEGKISKGTLLGNLYLKGYGDPMLSAGDLFDMALKLKKYGITKVNGSFIFDETYIKHVQNIAPLGDLDTTDNPGVSALSSEFNRFKLYSQGEELKASPSLPQLGGGWVKEDFPEDQNNVRQSGEVDLWKLSKKRDYRFPLHLPVKNPAPYTAQFFRMLAANEGISLPMPIPGVVSEKTKVIITHKGSRLIKLVDLNLEYSNNLLSEIMLLAAVKHRTGIEVTLEQAGSELKRWLVKFTGDKEWANTTLVSASGLNHHNMFSPQLLTRYLYKMRNKEYGGTFFRSILSISGLKGWLYKRMDGPESAYKVWAKTGTLDYSGGLAGYLYTKKGKRYAFTILTSNYKLREKLETSTSKERKELEDEAGAWKKNIRNEHDNQIEEWIEEL